MHKFYQSVKLCTRCRSITIDRTMGEIRHINYFTCYLSAYDTSNRSADVVACVTTQICRFVGSIAIVSRIINYMNMVLHIVYDL